MLQNIQNQLNLIYLNTDEHTHLDRSTGNTDILDMAFASLNLSKHDIQFLIGDDLGSDHLPIEIAMDTPPHRNTHINPVRYKFNQTDREVFESTLEVALSSGDVPELKSTQDIDKYADFITTAITTAVDKAIPKSKSGRPESQPISDETLVLIKEKRKLRWQYSQAHDPLVKTRINQLQKEIKDNLRIESQASWEKFCTDISLENDHTESWRKIKNFLKPKGQRDYPALRLDAKTAKTNADKAQLFAESVERHFGIQSNNFDSKHFDEVNQFIEDNYEYFYPPEDPNDYRSDKDDDHDLVADVDSDTLIKLVKFLKRGKASRAASRNVHIAAKLLQKDLRKLAKWCAKWRIKLNPEKAKVIIFSWSSLARISEPTLKLYGEKLKIYRQVKFLGITFDSKFTFKNTLRTSWGAAMPGTNESDF